MEMKTERFQLMWEKSLVERVDDFGFSNRIRTRASAVRQLVLKGLEAYEAEKEKGEALA